MNLEKKVLYSAIAVALGLIATIVVCFVLVSKKGNDGYTFYYSLTCPHCKIVEEFMVENKTEERISMVKKEVSQSRDNAADFLTKASKCGYKLEEAGVPLLFHDGKCLMGDKDIIDYLKQN